MLMMKKLSTQVQNKALVSSNSSVLYVLTSFVSYIALSLCLLALLTPLMSYGQSAPLVEVAKVKPWENGAAHNMHCIVAAPDLYQISSHTDARLLWSLPEGTQVSKGQVIAEQDSYYMDREIEQLKIDIASATVQDDFAQKELMRISALNKKQLVSASNVNQLSKLARQASLAKALLNAHLKELKYRHKNLIHYAPEDGQILTRQADLGKNLQDGEQILQFIPTSRNELMCEIPLQKYRQSQQLQNVVFTHTDKGSFSLNRQSYALDEKSQTVKIYLNANHETQQNMLIGERVKVTTRYYNSVLTRVPYDALELAENASYVWTVEADNTVKRMPVDVIETHANFFLVKSALKAGDSVVTLGKQGLRNEQLVSTTSNLAMTPDLESSL